MRGVTVRELGPEDRDYWDCRIQDFPHVHPFNVYDWGTVRQIDGWTPAYLVAEGDGGFRGALLLLMKRLPFLPFSIFCAPQGPLCAADDEQTIRAIHRHVLALAARHRAIFIRVDPNLRESESAAFERAAANLGYVHLEHRWSFWNSPRDEYRIDLDAAASVDELHHALDRDTRRCVRKGPKDGLQIETAASEADLQAFYAIFSECSVAKGFLVRSYEYQRTLWDRYVATGRGRLFLARYEGRVIGGLLCIAFGKKCVAMHMGVPYAYQKLQPYYALVWESIRWAKESGCAWYSFRGVGTTPTQEAFKRKFNPAVVSLAGYFDYAFRPLLYRLCTWLEFTLLLGSWPLIVKTRRVTVGALKRLTLQPAR